MLDELLTAEELARLFKVPTSFIYDRSRRRAVDRWPVIKIGKYNRYSAAAVRAHVERVTRERRG